MGLFNRSEKYTINTMKTGKWVFRLDETIEIEKETSISAFGKIDKKYFLVKTQNLEFKYQIMKKLDSLNTNGLYMREFIVLNEEEQVMTLQLLLINNKRVNVILSTPQADNLKLKIPFITFIGFVN